MNVLHLPLNIASQISVTVHALREKGVNTRGVVADNSLIQSPIGVEVLPKALSRRQHPVRGSWQYWRKKRVIFKAIDWADVIHWHSSWALRNAADVRYAAHLKKPGIVEFWGSDIRIPRIASLDNKYLDNMYRILHTDFCEAEARSLERQEMFAEHGIACLIPGVALLPHVDHSVFPAPYRIRQRVNIDDYHAVYPDPCRKRPLLVHMPSHKAKKGTDAVLKAIAALRETHDFEFELIHGVERSEALKSLQQADMFLDQFVIGSHGLATLEAMAFGKPTLCYIKPSLISEFPADCPIINASQDNMAEVLKPLLEDGQRRYEIGRASREYVEKYHDSRILAQQLVEIYKELLARPQRHTAL